MGHVFGGAGWGAGLQHVRTSHQTSVHPAPLPSHSQGGAGHAPLQLLQALLSGVDTPSVEASQQQQQRVGGVSLEAHSFEEGPDGWGLRVGVDGDQLRRWLWDGSGRAIDC